MYMASTVSMLSLPLLQVLPSVGDSITPLKKTPPHSAVITPHSTTVAPLSALAHANPTTTAVPSSGTGGEISGGFGGGFILGTSVMSPQVALTTSMAANPPSPLSLFSATSGPPIYSQPSSSAVDHSTVVEETMAFAGFPPIPPVSHEDPTTTIAGGVADSSSSESEGEESGSESDNEMSDNDEEGESSSSGEEEEEDDANKTITSHPQAGEQTAHKPSAGSSVSLSQLFIGDDSFSFQGGGFFNDEDFLSRLQGDVGGQAQRGESDARDTASESRWFEQFQPTTAATEEGDTSSGPVPVNFGGPVSESLPMTVPLSQHLSSTVIPPSAYAVETSALPPTSTADSTQSHTTATASAILTHQHSLDATIRRMSGGKKRKLERQQSLDDAADSSLKLLQPPARKTLRSTIRRRDSSRSSFSVSSDSSDSSDDEQSDTEQPLSPSNATSLPTLQNVLPISSSEVPSLPSQTPSLHANPPPPSGSLAPPPPSQRQLEAGELEEEEEEGEEEGEGEGEEEEEGEGERWRREETEGGDVLDRLWVKVPLEKIEREQKPKVKSNRGKTAQVS